MVGYHSIDWLNRKSSIGYWLARDEQGRGTMTEAVRAHVDHAFATWGLNRITHPGRGRERAQPRDPRAPRASARRASCARSSASAGRMLDGVVYAMLAADWPGRD